MKTAMKITDLILKCGKRIHRKMFGKIMFIISVAYFE